MLTFLIDLARAIAIAIGLMGLTWVSTQVWDRLCGYRKPVERNDSEDERNGWFGEHGLLP